MDKVQSTIFKDGIKIPGTKKAIKLNNIGGALKETIFNKKSSMYVVTDNLIDRYNLRVSDELMAGLALVNTIIKTATIVDVKDKKNKDSDDEEVKKIALSQDNVMKFVEGHEIKKIIVVKNKIVNIVVA